jgi:hypothetical protein
MIDEKKLLNEMIDLLAKDCKDMELCGKIVGLISVQPTIQPQGIDKDRLIEELKKEIDSLEKEYLTVFKTEFLDEMAGLHTAIKIINQQPTTDGWIPCSRELPRNDVNVFVTDADGNVFMACYDAQYDDRYGEWLENECVVENIVAWQPIIYPQPYKESE